jgi:outer membrane protein OmpA-like peptidoglycan-associated protein
MALYSVKIDTEEAPKLFSFVDKDYSFMHPALSSDAKTLYFTSDKPGGFGGYDIYFSEFTGTEWADPRNAGPIINTAGDEVFPYTICNKLFFSSDKHSGMGGLDVFACEIVKQGVFDKLENLKSPINSKHDDFGVLINDSITNGLFSSNRDGTDNIYAFNLLPKKIEPIIEDTIITMENEKPLMFVKLFVKFKETGNPVPDAVIVMNDKDFLQSDENGFFMLQVPEKTNYTFSAELEGFYKTRVDLITPEAVGIDTIFISQILMMDEIVIEKVIVLEDIYYDYDKWDIRPDAAIELDKLVQMLRDNTEIEIELSSHTDSRGNDEYNMKLSQRRAESAVNYIISQGIDSKRIVANYYGESKPLNHCLNGVQCPEELHQQNRRTEIKVTKINEDNTKIVYSSKYFNYLTELASQGNHSEGEQNYVYANLSSQQNQINENTNAPKMWHIVAGSFKYIENANVFAKQMRSAGYTDTRILVELSGNFYRVSIGSFANLAIATKTISEIKMKTSNNKLWLIFE